MSKAMTKSFQTDNFTIDVFIDPYNKRIRIDDLRGNVNAAMEKAEELISQYQFEKLIVMSRKEQCIPLLEKGFQCEAMVNHFFLGSDGFYFCKYYHPDRRRNEKWIKEDEIVRKVQALERETTITTPPKNYQLQLATKEHAGQLANLYKNVFEIYPTPVHDPTYIIKTMDEGTIYYTVMFEDEIVSAASADVNLLYHNAELTDCATLNEHRKYGLMKILLNSLEEELISRGIFCAYSIARALSFGMNAALHQLGYHYRGRLINNCFIFDKIENMNVWAKDLSSS